MIAPVVTPSLTAGEWGQFTVVLVLCAIAAAWVLRAIRRRRRPRLRLTVIQPVVPPVERAELARQVQAMIAELRAQVERHPPEQRTP